MKFKRFVAALLAAGMVVTTAFSGNSVTMAADQKTPVKVTEDQKRISTDEKKDSEENPWIDSIGKADEKKEEDADRYPERDTTLPQEKAEGVQSSDDNQQIKNKQDVKVTEENSNVTLKETDKSSVSANLYATEQEKLDALEEVPQENEIVRVIIVMDGNSIIEKDAKATMNFFTKLQVGWMESKQNRMVSKIEKNILDGEEMEVKYHYTWLLNGVATEVPYGMIDEIEDMKGVEEVILQPVYEIQDQDIETYTIADGNMIGREDTWASGYTGKGTKIAIIDTGLDDDHQNFQAMSEDKLTEDSATKESISSVLGSLNASDLYPNLTVDQVYRNNKVAFAFNYIDQNTIVNHSRDTQGDHGTHVAGIAAANDLGNGEAVGVAPDAQLYVMKIFGVNGGAYAEDILASLEDALKLGADVINMSLGSPAGFTSAGEQIDEIYARVADTNTILAVAAGNSTTAGLGNMWGTDTNLASNPDNSIISSPAVYQNVTSVASIENESVQTNYLEVNDHKFAYIEASEGYNEAITTLAGQELEYAMVDNYGQTLDDFINAGVEGKVAVVQRGLTNFTAKHELAQEAGAIACVIYNNTTGSLSMGLTDGYGTIPCVSITLSAGEFLKTAKEENPQVTLEVSAKKGLLPNDEAYRMSSFSSWGVAPNLTLEPDITAPGGNIYSTLDGGQYGIMSGTSMATPNVAGLSALVMQYAKATYPNMSDADLHDFVNALLLSTSVPVSYSEDVTYSPRLQGSGLANAYAATKTKAYLSVDNNDMPKAELFDDVEKTGQYQFTYHVNNFGENAIYYSLSTNAQTEGVETYNDHKFMATTPIPMSSATSESSDQMIPVYDYDENGATDSHDARELYLTVIGKSQPETNAEFRYEVNQTEGSDQSDVQSYLDALVGKDSEAKLDQKVLQVKSGATADVTVSISLSQNDRDYMNENFENGIYVEGFTSLTARSTGDVDLSMPYLGFYGDWTQAPMIDDGYYWDEEVSNASQYPNIIWTSIQGSNWLPGLNPYIADEPFDIANITMSPNDDGITDTIEDIYVSLMRNANTVDLSFENAETKEVYYHETYDKVVKTYYASSGTMIPFLHSYYSNNRYGFTDQNGNVLPSDTVVTMKAKATVDYDRHESANKFDTWEVDFTVDTEAPVVKDAQIVKADGRQYLRLTFQDNQKVAAVCFLNKSGAVVKATYGVDAKAGEEVTAEYDITGYGNEFMIVIGDYAVNETFYEVETTDNVPEVNASLLYGYRVYSETIYDDTVYGWVAINDEKINEEGKIVVDAQDSEYYMDYSLQAAEYIDGYVLAVNAGGQLVRLTPGVWDDRTVITEYGFEIKELTYDPVEKVLYGYTSNQDNGTYEIIKIDILTGQLTGLGELYTWTSSRPHALACDSEGTLYGINSKGQLQTINKENGRWNQEVLAETGLTPAGVQSMVYDAEDQCFYWAAYLMDETSALYKIDLANNYELTKIASFDDNPQINGLIQIKDQGFDIPEENANAIITSTDSLSVLKGKSTSLNIAADPWYGNVGTLVWSSSDESIASVDLKGTITGKKAGTVTITVASKEVPSLKATCTVQVIEPQSDLYGYVIGSNAGVSNQWIKVNTGYLKGAETVSGVSLVTYAAAEYYDGCIYAYNDSTEFYKIDPETHKETKITNANSEWSLKDMSFDYSTGYMYGIATWNMDGMTYLIHIDITTGLIEKANERALVDDKYGMPIALAVSTDGVIYIITETGYLCKYVDDNNEEAWEPLVLEKVGVTGVTHANGLTSMVYDHNTGDMYFNYANLITVEQLALIDQNNGTALTIGAVANGAQIVGLYSVPDQSKLPEREEVPVTGVTATSEIVNMVSGMQIAVPINIQPFNASDKTIQWAISDESVVSIKDNVLIAGKKGTAVVTAKVGSFTAEFQVNVYETAGDLTGFVVYDFMYEDTNIWANFNDSDLTTGVGLANADEYQADAAEYYNGKVYVYDNMKSQYLVLDGTSGKFEVEKRITGEHPDMVDMAFDYSEGVMYALSNVRNVNGNTSLYAINLENGGYYKIGEQSVAMVALACSTEGQLYAVDGRGDFYTIDKRTGKQEYVFSTNYEANVYQSMTYDHNTGNLYWAQCYFDIEMGADANLVLIDVEKQVALELGKVGASGCEVTGLYIQPKVELTVQKPEVESIKLSSNDEMMAVGDTVEILAFTEPLSVAYADAEFTFRSSDQSVATVDENGIVKAVGVGTANITASYKGLDATCKITVVDEATELYVMNPNGWQTSPLMSPMTISGESLLSAQNTELRIERATLNSDGYFYAIGEDGYLWKFTKDLLQIEKIGEQPVLEQLDNRQALEEANPYDGIWSLRLKDLTANTFNGKVYALVEVNWYLCYVYEVDLQTGAATLVRELPSDLALAQAMTFESEDSLIVYEGNMDFIYRVSLTGGEATALVWAQGILVASDDLAMYYSKELNRVFITTLNDDPRIDAVPTMGLYVLNMETSSFKRFSQAAYNQSVTGLIMFEGIEPATGVVGTEE